MSGKLGEGGDKSAKTLPPEIKEGKSGGGIDGIEETKTILRGQKKVKIMIPSTETDHDDVKVGVNGYVYQIQRDKVVEVPESVIGVLKDAITAEYRQVKRADGGEGYELVPMEAMRHAFQVS